MDIGNSKQVINQQPLYNRGCINPKMMKQNVIDYLRSYAWRYHSASIVDNGAGEWICTKDCVSLAAIAKKAIEHNLHVEYKRNGQLIIKIL